MAISWSNNLAANCVVLRASATDTVGDIRKAISCSNSLAGNCVVRLCLSGSRGVLPRTLPSMAARLRERARSARRRQPKAGGLWVLRGAVTWKGRLFIGLLAASLPSRWGTAPLK